MGKLLNGAFAWRSRSRQISKTYGRVYRAAVVIAQAKLRRLIRNRLPPLLVLASV